MTFGFATGIDALSWAVAVLLALKLLATALLLLDPRRRHGEAWWWATKLTPVVAVALALAIAARTGNREELLIYAGLALFVAVAVPWKVRQHLATRLGAGSAPALQRARVPGQRR